MENFSANIPGLSILPVYGGTGYSEQIRELKRGAQVVSEYARSGDGPCTEEVHEA